MALSPELIAAFQKDRMAGYLDPEGNWISQSTGGAFDPANPNMQIGDYNASGGISPDLMAAMGFADPSGQHYTYGNGGERGSGKIGDKYQIMDSAGEYTGKDGTYSAKGMDPALMALLAAGAMYGAGSFINGGFLGAGGATSATGAAGAGTGGMVNGAFLGEGVLSGVPAWDGALSAAGAAGAGGAAGAASGSGGIGGGAGNGAFLGEGVASGVPAWDAAATKAGLSLTGAGSSLLPGISDKALGIGASLLGGALGSQGQKAEQSSTRDIPDWLKPYVTNTLTKAQGLFDTQMSPEYQQRWTNLGNQAQGLLAQPMAGNGFNRFFPGK